MAPRALPVLRPRTPLTASLLVALVACAGDPPPKTAASAGGEVPANSESENREENERRRRRADEVAAMPTTPTVGEATGGTSPPSGPRPTKGGPKATRTECEKALDRYIELQLTTNPELAAVAKDLKQGGMLEALKAQARQQNGGKTPCETDGISRAQYTCGVAATTLDGWRKCME